VAAQYVHVTGQAAPPTTLVVYATDILNIRAQPSTDANILTMTISGEALTVLGDIDNGRARIEQQGQWLNVKTSAGYSGYVAAWLVSMTQPSPTPPAQTLTVYATDVLNLRAQSTTNAPVLTSITAGQALIVSEGDLAAAQAKIGQQGQWLYVQTSDGQRGWVAAWYLSANPV
jgi:N-acetylmuramoyl-L-alanine amidase